jgi:dephospho-CoA kinase
VNIIGIAGTNGSGKDTVGQMLAERHGWLFISVTRDMLRKEVKRRGLPIERENLRAISAEWRREGGLGVLVDKSIEEFEAKGGQKKYKGLAIASLRNPGEPDRIHEFGGSVIWVDAVPKIRFVRVMKRKRGTEDVKTFEEFLAEQAAEMRSSGDEATLNIAGVKAKADIFLENNGDDIEAFKDAAEKALKNRGIGL